jgi:hypothetical protein
MNAAVQAIENALDGLSRKDRLRIAERVLLDEGFTSLLPSMHPIEPALPGGELDALAAVGLRTTSKTRERARSARVRYASTFLDLFNNADTPAELAKKLGLDPSRIRQRIRDHSLLAIELNGEKRVPRFQFEGSVEVPGLSRVLADVDEQVTPLAFAMWFLSPTSDLAVGEGDAPISPRDWLLQTGDVEAVLAIVGDT